MKKWLAGYIVLSLIVLGVITFVGAERLGKESACSEVHKESGIVFQSVNSSHGSYLLIKTDEDVVTVRTDNGRDNYNILDTLYYENCIVYMYEYTENNDRVYGIGSYNAEADRHYTYNIDNLSGYDWLALGVVNDIPYCLMNDIGNRTLTEFMVNASGTKDWEISQTIAFPDKEYIIMADYFDENINICLDNGSVYYYEGMSIQYYDDINKSPFAETGNHTLDNNFENTWRLRCLADSFLKVIAIWAVITVTGGLIVAGLTAENAFVLRMFSFAELGILVVLIGLTISAGVYLHNRAISRAYEAAETGLTELMENVNASNTISYDVLYEAADNGCYPFAELLLINDNTSSMEISASLTRLYTDVEPKLLKAIDRGASTESVLRNIVNHDGKKYLVTSVYKEGLGSNTLLVGFTDYNIIAFELKVTAGDIWLRLIIVFAAGTLMNLIGYIIYALKWRRFSNVLVSVATNDAIRLPARFPGSMARVWGAAEQLHNIIGGREYEVAQKFEKYNKFIPKDIEKVLDRQSLSDIEPGDMKMLNANIAVFSMDNINIDNNEKYMAAASKSFETVHNSVKAKGGIMISQDCCFTNGKAVFTDNTKQAVDFAVEILSTLRNLSDVNRLVIINHTPCSIGVIGCDERAVPFVHYSGEDIFVKYTEPLKRAGVQLVLTESAVDCCTGKFSFRYIGYIAENGTNIKLYECFDAYPKYKKELLERTHARFKKALGLFYSNDFYLARNAFNEVLKENPEDSIARWYLFNCEHNLNNMTEDDISYGLFGNRIYEQQYRN